MDELRKYIPRLKKLLRRRGGAHLEAEDLIQDALIRVQEYCRTHPVRETEALLVRTVQNLEIDAHRHEHRHLYVNDAVERLSLVDTAPLPDEVVEAQQDLENALEVLESLHCNVRQAFVMHRLHEYTYEQIADVLGVSKVTVGKYISIALLALLNQGQKK